MDQAHYNEGMQVITLGLARNPKSTLTVKITKRVSRALHLATVLTNGEVTLDEGLKGGVKVRAWASLLSRTCCSIT